MGIALPLTAMGNEQSKEIVEDLNAGQNGTDDIFMSKAKSSQNKSYWRENKKHQP